MAELNCALRLRMPLCISTSPSTLDPSILFRSPSRSLKNSRLSAAFLRSSERNRSFCDEDQASVSFIIEHFAPPFYFDSPEYSRGTLDRFALPALQISSFSLAVLRAVRSAFLRYDLLARSVSLTPPLSPRHVDYGVWSSAQQHQHHAANG